MARATATRQQFLLENKALKLRLTECEDTLEAIRTGAVDALVVADAQGERIFTLQSTDHSFRVMAENMSEGAVILDKEGIVVFANKSFSSMAGRELPSLVGARFSSSMSISSHEGLSAFIEQCALRPCRGHFSIASLHDGALPVAISGTNFSVNGKENVCLIISDLRERREAEARLQNAYEEVEQKVVERTLELRRRKEEYRTLSENSPDSIARFGTDLRNLYVNSQAKKISGMDLTGKTWREAGLPRDYILFWEERLNRVIQTRNVECVESRFQSPNATEYILLSTIAPEFDDDGKVLSVLVVSRDITESNRAAEALRHNVRQLSIANKELGSFNLSLSHDLRNPLHAILSCISVLSKSKKDMNGEAQSAIDNIKLMTERMSLVLGDMLSLSRVSRVDMRSSAVELSTLAQDVAKHLRASNPERKAEIIITPGLTASADKGLIGILLDNLLQNAWKFSSKCARTRIEFGATYASGQPVYFVRDNGAGFDMAAAGRMFVPFCRFHPHDEFPGTGIGLSIAKRIVERHDGAIWAESAPGKGATFFFTLSADHAAPIRP